jgi:hypothetical protein
VAAEGRGGEVRATGTISNDLQALEKWDCTVAQLMTLTFTQILSTLFLSRNRLK